MKLSSVIVLLTLPALSIAASFQRDELVRDQRRTLRSKGGGGGKGSKEKPDPEEEEEEEEEDKSACELASEADLCCSGDFKTCPTSCHGNIATCECDVGGVDGGYFPTLKSNVGDSCLRRWDTSCTPENDTCCCPATCKMNQDGVYQCLVQEV